jgi:hypothetical protein
MNKVVISAVTALAISITSADAMDMYVDEKGQVFITPAKGRVSIDSPEAEAIKAKLLANPEPIAATVPMHDNESTSSQTKTLQDEVTALKKDVKSLKKVTPIFAKSSKLKFSGTHYLGYNYKSYKSLSAADGGPRKSDDTGNFEMRRNYFQVKAYVLDDPKSYLRVTLDATYDQGKAENIHNEVDDHADVYVKYAYLYLDDVLPYTGVEFGMAHRPWIDYEEHQGWWMRSISKVFAEASEASHLTNSSDMGVNFKTKTPYFTSEIGIFNGEGYHGENGDEEVIGGGNSVEWRATVAALGNGDKKRKPTKDSYLDASFFGQYNMDNSKNEVLGISGIKSYDYTILGFHAVYNMPSFLISAQYISADNDASDKGVKGTSKFNGEGYSINGTVRMGDKKQYSVFGRYDRWEAENDHISVNSKYKTDNYIYGFGWQQNKNFKWLLTGQTYEAKDNKNYKGKTVQDWNSAMLTAEVHW